MTERKRVLITGAGGFVGHHVMEHVLSKTSWDVVVTDSFRHKGKTDRISEVLDASPIARKPISEYLQFGDDWRARTTVITHDLTVPFSPQAVAKIGHVDYIIAVASESHVDRSIEDPVSFTRNNVDVALTTMELARRMPSLKSVVWVSTDEVYGPVTADDAVGHPEWSPVLPSNPYAGSKAAQEAIVMSYWRTYGVPAQIVNCMNMIGERQDPEKFVPMTISKVLRGETVTVHGSKVPTPGGDSYTEIGTRCYLHSRNLADGILFLLQNKEPQRFSANSYSGSILRPDRYNVVAPDRIDNLRLAQMIAEYAGRPLRYKLVDFHSTRPGHDPHYALDGSKMAALGWTLPVPLEESLRKTVRWSIRHPEWLEQ